MVDMSIVITALQNPAVIGIIIAIIYNIGGYITACFRAKTLLAYDKFQLFTTLGLFETLFILLQGLGGLDTGIVTTIAVILNVIVSLKNYIKPTTSTT